MLRFRIIKNASFLLRPRQRFHGVFDCPQCAYMTWCDAFVTLCMPERAEPAMFVSFRASHISEITKVVMSTKFKAIWSKFRQSVDSGRRIETDLNSNISTLSSPSTDGTANAELANSEAMPTSEHCSLFPHACIDNDRKFCKIYVKRLS